MALMKIGVDRVRAIDSKEAEMAIENHLTRGAGTCGFEYLRLNEKTGEIQIKGHAGGKAVLIYDSNRKRFKVTLC